MSARTEADQELGTMLDEGVTVELVELEDGIYQLRLAVDEAVCAECLVPDPTLVSIATDAIQRRGAPVSSMSVLRPA